MEFIYMNDKQTKERLAKDSRFKLSQNKKIDMKNQSLQMLNETKMSCLDNSFSSKVKFESSHHSQSSMQLAKGYDRAWNTRQIVSSREERKSKESQNLQMERKDKKFVVNSREDSKRELPILSNQKILETKQPNEDSSSKQYESSSSFSKQFIPIDINQRQSSQGAVSTHKNSQIPINPNIKVEDYLNVYIPQYVPYTQPSYSHFNTVNQSTQSSVDANGNSMINSPRIQRRLNVSSCKSLSHKSLSQAKGLSQLQSLNYEALTPNYQYEALTPKRPSALKPSHRQNSQAQQSNLHQQQFYHIQAQQPFQQIKTISNVTHVPYYETHIEYVPEVIMVPRQNVIQKHYVVENLVDYVPRVEEYVEGVDLIPQEVINYRLQYQLVEKQIVHLPKDQNWVRGVAQIKRRENHDANRKAKRPNRPIPIQIDAKRVASPVGFIQRTYYDSRASDNPRSTSLKSKYLNSVSSFGQKVQQLENQHIPHNIYTTRGAINQSLILQPLITVSPSQQSPDQSSPYFRSATPLNLSPQKARTHLYPTKDNIYDNMVNYYANRPQSSKIINSQSRQDLAKNLKRRHKQTFHVTSQTNSSHNDHTNFE